MAAGAGRAAILPSLGASGAIYATVVVTALAFPDSRVSLIFFPFFTLPIGAGIGAMVLGDVAGIIWGWRFFDHAAHLAGATCGLLAFYTGRPFFDSVRIFVKQVRSMTSITGKE
ncbi:MAG: hypothetical protein CYPHOPRED_006099 [Cyphobasidiales sp. Tagirdzhanova-0007]|nr:MAG: hypothetical protein CYPHOPRED_006099 [Cyphobasidiales sp. Tagirdzhanova-0007]